MPSDRVQRQIDRLLDEAEQAIAGRDLALVEARCDAALALDAQNADALSYLAAARQRLHGQAGTAEAQSTGAPPPAPAPLPASFVNGRFVVQSLLGEGGRKVVYRAHDMRLDRDVACALIKTNGLDAGERERVQREAGTLGRLNGHPKWGRARSYGTRSPTRSPATIWSTDSSSLPTKRRSSTIERGNSSRGSSLRSDKRYRQHPSARRLVRHRRRRPHEFRVLRR